MEMIGFRYHAIIGELCQWTKLIEQGNGSQDTIGDFYILGDEVKPVSNKLT